MWFVIQTVSGRELHIKEQLDTLADDGTYTQCFVPLYEEVHHRSTGSRIVFKRLFPGYLFIETDSPAIVHRLLRSIPEFARVLGDQEDGGDILFIPVGEQDEEFLRTLLDDGIMHVSYVHLSKSNRIDRVAGPLSHYRNHITKMEFRHRFAIAEMEVLGKRRKIRFGLWGDKDPKNPWLMKQMEGTPASAIDEGAGIDIGIHPGDKVVDSTGVYGEYVFTVKDVDAKHRRVYATIELFGGTRQIELMADGVEKIGG